MQERAKIRLLIVNTVPTERNGITNVVLNLLTAFEHNGISIGYVAISEPETSYKNQLELLGGKLYVISRKITHPHEYVCKLAKIAAGYDIIHVHGNSATMVLEMIAAKMAKVPVRIAHSHNTSCNQKMIDRVMRPLFYGLCNVRLACGNEAGKWLYGDRDFHVVNNGIDTEKFRFNPEYRKELRIALGWDNCRIIGNVGNLVTQKNPHFLLEIFEVFQKKNPDARLLILGEGMLRDILEEYVESRNLTEKVKFMGSVGNPQNYMCAMDVVVMPSLYEGFPLTTVEEQANGLHIIASDKITKDVDLTGNVTFVPLEAPAEKWSEEISEALSQQPDREQESDCAIQRIIKAGFNINEIAKNLELLYKDSLSHD